MDHPIVKWGGIGLTIVGATVGTVTYLESVKSRIDTLHHAIHEHSIMLREIQETQAQHFAQREDRFEELEVGQRNIKDTLTTSQDDLFHHIGVLKGRLIERNHSDKRRSENGKR